MSTQLVFETHSISVDNERGIATGWLPGQLSDRGRILARSLGERRRNDDIACVFTSDLRRAVETAEIAFDGCDIELRRDARLRECSYGRLNGAPVEAIAPRRRFVDQSYPDGESWRDCAGSMDSFLHEIAPEFAGRRVLVIAHSAQRFALRHLLEGEPLEDLVDAPFDWQEGWEYRISAETLAALPRPTLRDLGRPVPARAGASRPSDVSKELRADETDCASLL